MGTWWGGVKGRSVVSGFGVSLLGQNGDTSSAPEKITRGSQVDGRSTGWL